MTIRDIAKHHDRHLRRITRALLSVSDKTGLVEFARALGGHGIELVSTGGTAKALADAGLKVLDVVRAHRLSRDDGRPGQDAASRRCMAGCSRSATTRSTPRRWQAHGIRPIDLLVVNLYPFEATVAKGADFDDCIENIDIGGPAMIRAAAKNHADVAVVVEPEDYAALLAELDAARRRDHAGAAQEARRQGLCAHRRLRRRDLQLVRATSSAIPRRRTAPSAASSPRRCATARTRTRAAAFYRTPEQRSGVATARQVQGKQLSYNNINDTDAAYECVAEFDPSAHRRLRHHQARQSLRRRRGREPARGLSQGAGLRSDLGVRRHRRAQPHARRRGRARHHRDLHRGDHRAGRDRGGDRDRRREEEPAAAARRRPARSARRRA